MLFNSIEFIIFFPIVVTLYFCLPHRFRVFFLLVASSIFYMRLIPWYILVLLFLIIADYTAGIYIEKETGSRRKFFLLLSIISTSSVLFVFKYVVLLNELTSSFLSFFSIDFSIPTLKWALPIGLSFHTFQSLSYVIEVYRGNQKAEKNFWIYSLYVMFFSQLVAGPIERPGHMIPQFREVHYFSYQNMVEGGRLILWGFFKKVVVADRIALLVDYVFKNIDSLAGVPVLLGIGLFAIQIYLDFSAYSDIARGTAKCMGFDLSINFNRPYFATSVGDFWQRWHISLTSWLRDYVYIPLGGNKVSAIRNRINIMIVFVLSGVWHGAHIHYIAWGMLNGLYIILERLIGINRVVTKPKFYSLFKVFVERLLVFIFAAFAFTFFRAESVHSALFMLEKSIQGLMTDITRIVNTILNSGSVTSIWFNNQEFLLSYILFYLLVIWFVEYFFERPDIQFHQKVSLWFKEKEWFRWSIYYFLLFSIVFLGVFRHTPFVYFQF